ncbi:MAG TPA: methylenetetrahydrofolate reductase [NAD(P)H] [Saprospiraceae bacterium]|nr:methylenetetrahydrofolate reductase [NAD(P)H] [Saprospiraceae bacterium]
MKVTEYLKQSKGKTLISFEVLPPLKGGSIKSIFQSLDPIMEFQPPFIDVTYHREEFLYNIQPSGYYQKIAIRKRPGTVGICSAIMHHYGVEAVPHLICGGFTKEDTENALIELHFLNINNVLALRGDARKFDDKFIPEPGGNEYALDLVQQIGRMNQGVYLDPSIENGSRTDFCVGIAGYPEKHFEAPNMKSELKFTRKKMEAGADYIVTQMFYDNQKYFDYVAQCRKEGIHIPIIPGIKPLTKRYQLASIPRHFYINIPDELVKEVNKATTDQAVREVGIEWCVAQCLELKKQGVPCLHFYTMGDSQTIRKIVERVL